MAHWRTLLEVMVMIIKTKYLGPTDRRGARIRATDINAKKSIIVPYDYSVGRHEAHLMAARLLCKRLDRYGEFAWEDYKDGLILVEITEKEVI